MQESWLRLDADAANIRDLRPTLTTMVGRIRLDRLRHAAARREQQVGQGLSEPRPRPIPIGGKDAELDRSESPSVPQ
jgi:hypothetical protein